MAIQVIYLDEDDDIVSVCDRLSWARESQIVLILPDQGPLLTDYLDLSLLRRKADTLRQEVGLVTGNHKVISQAKALGFPTFPSLRAASRSKRGWWRGRRRTEVVGQPTRLEPDDRAEVIQRKRERPEWQRWLLRYAAIWFYFLTLAILFLAAAYALPGATITLKPEVEPITVRRQIVADPALESIDASGASVPGRVLTSIQEWQAEVETTGVVEVADAPAKGRVVFVNQLDQPVEVPAGTRVSTTAGDRVVFQTEELVVVPGVVGGTVEVDVVAVEPGTTGNVAANRINLVEGALGIQLRVRNLESTDGGGVRVEKAVTEADHERLRSQVMQQIQVRALADMESMLQEGEFLARDSLRVTQILQENYSFFPGEQSERLTLEIRAELQATAVDETQAVGLAYEEMVKNLIPGFELVPDSLVFQGGEVQGVDGQGRVTFEMVGEGLMAASLGTEEVIQDISGQKTSLATAYLYENLPLRDYPSVSIWPDWFGRMPYLPVRIRIQTDTGR